MKDQIANSIKNALLKEFNYETHNIQLENTKADQNGDFTFVIFPHLKALKTNPTVAGQKIGQFVLQETGLIKSFDVVSGFLNFIIDESKWIDFIVSANITENFGKQNSNKQHILIEYSSPNTNKPLHLGHIRNNLLGIALSNILQFAGYKVTTVNLINDRGIHICKSMHAWMALANGQTPKDVGQKGDHFVGNYYVQFEKLRKEQTDINYNKIKQGDFSFLSDLGLQKVKTILQKIDEAQTSALKTQLTNALKEIASNYTPAMIAARELLRKWEKADKEVVEVWKMMNDWVYEGFNQTYERMGACFDHYYYESNTYLLGKKLVQEGLQNNVLSQNEDGSIWATLSHEKLDNKLLLRKDGTSVYMTQDLGTADLKAKDYHPDESLYVVGNEQEHHFKVLKIILKMLGKAYWNTIYHYSYGMVDLPTGKMKSREGTVIDADDLMDELRDFAKERTLSLGKTDNISENEKQELYESLGQGALKYFILKYEPSKRILFNKEESIDFQGNTGPFLQYTHARISSLINQAKNREISFDITQTIVPKEEEIDLGKIIYLWEEKVIEAANHKSPALIANYLFDLSKAYNRFYQAHKVLSENNISYRAFRLQLSQLTGTVLKKGLALLGINAPHRM